MRLYQALEHFKAGHVRAMEPWTPGVLEAYVKHIQAGAERCAEFSFSFLDPDATDDTLQTFIDFSNELWDAEIAPITHDEFWISWEQKISTEIIHMAAHCERVAGNDGRTSSLYVRTIFKNKQRSDVIFVNQHGQKEVGSHKLVLVSDMKNKVTGGLADMGFEVAAALIGALATPQAIRRNEPVPLKLNKQRIQKGRAPIGARLRRCAGMEDRRELHRERERCYPKTSRVVPAPL